jgi:hypothetical protein
MGAEAEESWTVGLPEVHTVEVDLIDGQEIHPQRSGPSHKGRVKQAVALLLMAIC